MLVSNVSLWGAALVALLVVIALVTLAFLDKKMLRRMQLIFGATVVQMALVGAVVWLVYQTHAWWAFLLWYLLILLLSVCWCLYPLYFMWKKMLLPISIVLSGSTMLCLPSSVFMTVYSVLMACLTASMIQTMVNPLRSLHTPEAHKQDMSWRESVLPQVRSMAQPLVMVMPMLYAGMLLGGVPAFAGLIIVLLLVAASFVANVLAGVVALLLSR